MSKNSISEHQMTILRDPYQELPIVCKSFRQGQLNLSLSLERLIAGQRNSFFIYGF
jgi:hypothetical protein